MAKTKIIRFNLQTASRELNIHKDTLAKRLKAVDIRPDRLGTYSVRDIVDAMSGDLQAERVKKIRAETEEIEIRVKKLKQEVVSSDRIGQFIADMLLALRRIILSSSMTDPEKDECLRQLRDVKPGELSDATDA